jgi:hypothetical protein
MRYGGFGVHGHRDQVQLCHDSSSAERHDAVKFNVVDDGTVHHFFPNFVFMRPQQHSGTNQLEIHWCERSEYLEKNLCMDDVFECVAGACLTAR